MRNRYCGNIIQVRAVEDTIRASKKYTEGLITKFYHHPQEIQGTEFPSRDFYKYYEVYPDIEISWDMPAGQAMDWLWGETACIDVRFHYDYRNNKATLLISDGDDDISQLKRNIKGFTEAIEQLKFDVNNKEVRHALGTQSIKR